MATRGEGREARERFDISVLVAEEAKAGDPEAAHKRIEAIAGLPIVEINEEAERLARQLLDGKVIRQGSPEDALHVALATVHGMDCVLTWNFHHINNAEMKARIG